ncbi:ThiF family adenylyltransferase [Avibacterium paragallinarum]|uniref:ThiF family adenylyltransferase n=2 Tax=Avibacterium paragallinarum TaxID=728 RepID=UPI001F3A2468|nr:ThiF family adenylyltransferase [Avibacterium paragallinarum]UXN36582.1 ThiF family adenylyltransferase [Avibacterium paragallinarum]
MNHRNKIIEKLSYHQYEPISFSDFKNGQLSNKSICYKKEISIENKNTKIEYFLIFSNSALLDFPKIYITENQLLLLQKDFPHITQPIPHLQKRKITYLNNKLYYVCYFMENSQIIPRNDLSKFILSIEQCLMSFFVKLLDKNKYIQEYSEDFLGTVIVLSDLTNDKNHFWHIVKNKENYNFLNSKSKNNIFYLQINNKSKPNFLGLFKNNQITTRSFLNFIQKWDDDTYKKLREYLNRINKKNKKKPINILIEWKNKLMGVSLEWNDCQNNLLKNFFDKMFLNKKVVFYTVNLIDFKSSILRNLPEKSQNGLLNKKVFQVGLGAIGGYMADSLIKIGAGIDDEFTIIDNDILSIDNVGRHLLGVEYIGKRKPQAFKEYVQRQTFNQMPKLNIKTNNISDYNFQYFIDHPVDLIVDATGSIEVQEYLNELVQQIPLEYRPNLLHLWIFGNGECVQGFWCDAKLQNHQGGCIQCLGTSANELFESTLPIRNLNKEQRFGVCSAFTPYAVSGGMMASSLGINMILEWIETGMVKNNYQTRYNSEYQDEKINDMLIMADKNCPYCGEKYARSI